MTKRSRWWATYLVICLISVCIVGCCQSTDLDNQEEIDNDSTDDITDPNNNNDAPDAADPTDPISPDSGGDGTQ